MSRLPRLLRLSCLPLAMACGMISVALDAGHAEPTAKANSKSVHIKSTAARNDNRQPIHITAAKLDYFDKQSKLIYRGNVVAVRGDTTMKTPLLVVFLNPKQTSGSKRLPSSNSQVRRMEASGPVTIISKGQVATGDTGVYEKVENKIFLNGNVTLSQGPNVTQGDHLVYDTTSGQAVVTGHVRSMFLPDNKSSEEETAKTSSRTAGKTAPGERSR
jgi:lipopolysaccharide export system protein LptA